MVASSSSSSSPPLLPNIFQKILTQSVLKLSGDECYPEQITNQFKQFDSSMQSMIVYELVKDVVFNFKGDAEKFYPDFCFLFRDGNVFHGLDHHCNVLLGFVNLPIIF